MTQFFQVVILGLSLGGIYALMATGLTLIFGVMRIINLAHGVFMLFAAYITLLLFNNFQIDPILSILITMPLMFFLGVGIYKTLFPRIIDSPRYMEMTILLAFGLAMIVEGGLGFFFTGIYRSVNPSYAIEIFQFGTFYIPKAQLFGTLVSILLLGLLWALLNYTRIGYAVRATMQNRAAAQIVGVNVERVSTIAFGLGMALAGAAGSLLSVLFTFFPAKHWQWIAILMSLIVLGGLGSLMGAFTGALLLAVAAALVSHYLGPTWQPITFFLALFLVLLIKPEGLFGKKMEEG
ncbi:MAG: amino acid ABC transporter permease [Chloroflexi bacterium RBG_16_48_8]|nr:MAG: amino acid ABC transporter permease [Chloroflexi bacterium RBG_16_48_8]